MSEYLTIQEMEKSYSEGGYLISAQKQQMLRKHNKIPYIKIGQSIVYKRVDINNWLDSNKIEVA